jgi:uncharacterized protein (TIGR03905 family)
MKQITYPTWGTCSKFINFELDEDHRVHNVQFLGGCDGNTKGIGLLVEGMYAEDIIKKLYKPAVKTPPTMGAVITQTEIDFNVEPAAEPEPAVVTPPEPEPEPEEEKEPTILDKWKIWLNNLVNSVTE